MVHRPSDSRLLANLLNHEKEYAKQLLGLLDSSHVSLASFSAYAAASAPPASNAIIAVAGTLSSADDALRRYAGVVDTWREQLKELKDMEDDVGVIMRDREILVARLIKASKSKPNRDSFIGFSAAASGSSSSLKSDFSASLAFNLNASAKLSAAQAELQACEAHLAAKERELDERRASAVRDGLAARCRALMECGWAWGEMGKEGLRALDSLLNPNSSDGHEPPDRPPSPSRFYSKPLPDPIGRATSPDDSSIAPSQSASNIALPSSPTVPNGDTSYTEHAEQRTGTVSPPPADIPITHGKPEESVMVRTLPADSSGSGSNANANASYKRTPYSTPTRPFSRHIMEESERDQDQAGASSDEDLGAMTIVQNPRFADGPSGKGFSIRGSGNKASLMFPAATVSDVALRSPEKDEKRGHGHGHGFFGSIRGLFRGGQKEREDAHETDSDEETERQRSGIFFGREGDRGGGGGTWATRTDKNLRSAKMKNRFAESDTEPPVRAARMARGDSGQTQKLRKNKGPPGSKRRKKGVEKATVASDPDERLATRQMGEQSVTRWMNDGQFGGQQEEGTSSGKSKSNTMKKGKSKARGNVQAEGTESFTTTKSPFYLAPTSKHDTTLSDSHLPMGGGLSRDNSIGRGSIMSAPGGGRTRRASTMSNTMSNSASGFSNPNVHANSVQISTVDKPKPKRASQQTHERKASVGGSGTVVVNGIGGNGGQSLMSIVEGVSKANREGWKTHKASQSLPHTQYPSSGWGGINVPKAPARVTRTDLDSVPMAQASAPPSSTMILPKAPDSVIQPSGTGNENRSSQLIENGVLTRMSPVIAAPVPIVPSTSSGAFGSSSTSSLLPPRPLKSALRTPSPNPQMILQARRSVDVSSPLDRAAAERASRRTSVNKNREEDELSVSSYETSHENPDEDDTPLPPPPPPPHDPPSDLSASTASSQIHTAPARRKSVRVSLQPTFSATPPALDDDESHAPWGGREESKWGRKHGAAGEEKDIWEDSSEEDEEYRQARRLLLRAGKKKSKN